MDYREFLRTWYMGPYTNGHTWIVHQKKWCEEGEQEYLVEYIPRVIRRDEQRTGIDVYIPVNRRIVAIEKETLGDLLRAGKLPIPVVDFEGNMGLDGEWRGWESNLGSQKVRLSWWCEGPEEWKEFTTWVESFQEFLHCQLFPEEETYERGPYC